MKAYIAISGFIFGLLVIAHVLRLTVEGLRLARDPWYVLITLAAAGLCIWAFWLLRRPAHSRSKR